MSQTRRHFLQTAGAAGALSLGALKRVRAAEAPNQNIQVAIMGANGRGTELLNRILDPKAPMPGVTIAYICDVDERVRARASSRVNELTGKTPKTEVDIRKVLDDKSVDAVFVATPDHWHAPATILACTAGKHVYSEKPACHNPQEGEWMVAAARKNKRLVQLGTQSRSKPALVEAIEKIHAGDIGRTLYARCWYERPRETIGRGKPAPVPTWLDYSLWQGPAPERPYTDNKVHYNWHWFWHWGTGELGNNGVHPLDICRLALKVEYPQRVTSTGGHYRFDDEQETPDTNTATFQFADKLITYEGLSWYRARPDEAKYDISIHGEKGTVLMGWSDYVLYDREGKEIAKGTGDGNEGPHVKNFFDSIRGDAKLHAEIAEGVKSTLMCHLGNISWRTGRAINFDATTGKIVGDPEAMKLWQREYRPGWEPKV